MESLKFDLLNNTEEEFDRLELIASLKGYSKDQMVNMILLNIPVDLKGKLRREMDQEEKLKKDDGEAKYGWMKKYLFERSKLSNVTCDAASELARTKLRPGEKIIDFACRAEKLAREISNQIPEDAIAKMVIAKIIEEVPKKISTTLRTLDIKDTKSAISKAQILLNDYSDEVVASVSKSSYEKRIDVLEKEIARLRMPTPQNRYINRCEKCGCRSHLTRNCDGRVVCKICGRRGHIALLCKSGSKKATFHNRIGAIDENLSQALTTTVTDENEGEYTALIDSGSPKSLINLNNLNSRFSKSYVSCNLISICGKRLSACGIKRAKVQINDKQINWDFIVIEDLGVDAILGRDFLAYNKLCINFGDRTITSNSVVAHVNLTRSNEKHFIPEFLLDFKDVFSKHEYDLGKTHLISHSINTKMSDPISSKCYRLPQVLRDEAERKIDEMLKNRIIKKSTSSWRAPVTMPLKKNGTRRFAVDYRDLNRITEHSQYPLPDMNETIERLEGAKIFSTLDLKSAYWQIPMDSRDTTKTAFTLGPGYGIYEFLVLPFGLSGAPATCQKLMDSTLIGNKNALGYLDDVIVFSTDLPSHITHLRETIKQIKDAGLKINLEKCHFLQSEIEFLGHHISKDGIKTHPNRKKDLNNIRSPTNKNELKKFLGFAGFYQKFIKNFAMVATPLYDLLKEGKNFNWSSDCDSAFCEIKKILHELPMLRFPDKNKPIHLFTDASNFAVGAHLSQIEKNEYLPIYFASRKLNKSEENYSALDKEMLAIVWAIKKFKHFLLGRKFIVHSDHHPLKYLANFKDNHNRRARWLSDLMEYEFEVEHISGKKNLVADALSRIVGEINFGGMYDIDSKQKNDQEFQQFLESLKTGKLYDKLSKREFFDKLWKCRSKLTMNNSGQLIFCNKGKDRIVVPESFSKILARAIHEMDCGHAGLTKCLEMLQRNFFWPNMKETIAQVILTCEECGRNKLTIPKLKHELVPFNVNNALEDWHVDFIGPLPETQHANKYIIIWVDRLSKWVEAFAIPEQTAETAAMTLINQIVSRFGVPKSIHSDQGRQFESQLFAHTCQILHIDKSRSTPYHPQGNGQAERYVKTLKDRLRNLILQTGNDWDKVIDLALMTIRTTVNESTGLSPFQLLFGRIPNTINTKNFQANFKNQSYHLYAENLAKNIQRLQKLAKMKVESQKSKYKENYDTSIFQKEFKPGSWVRIRKENVNSLEPRFGKPMKVLQQQIQGTYLLQDNKGNKFTIHHDRLKAWPDDPKYQVNSEFKREIKIPSENKDFCQSNLPNFGGGRHVT